MFSWSRKGVPFIRFMPGSAGVGLVGLVLLRVAAAGDLLELEVEHRSGRYLVNAVLLVEARAEAVRRLLTDYEHLSALDPAITGSRVQAAPPPYDVRVSTEIEACVMLYCTTLRRVEDVREMGDRLIAVIVPEQSNFASGSAQWRLIPRGERVRVEYRAEMEPSFLIPPLIGPILVKQGLERELRRVLANLERMAESSGPSL